MNDKFYLVNESCILYEFDIQRIKDFWAYATGEIKNKLTSTSNDVNLLNMNINRLNKKITEVPEIEKSGIIKNIKDLQNKLSDRLKELEILQKANSGGRNILLGAAIIGGTVLSAIIYILLKKRKTKNKIKVEQEKKLAFDELEKTKQLVMMIKDQKRRQFYLDKIYDAQQKIIQTS